MRWFTNAGRPVVAVVVLVMCAPGEHHLAVLAGWDGRLAWGMAAVLAAYAGIAASVASNRPAGSPGKRSAVAGAVVSLGAAMAAQPVSHAFVTGWLSAEPRAPWQLVIAVSCVPPLVFGHLLHLAATPVTRSTETPTVAPAPAAETQDARPALQPLPTVQHWRDAVPPGVRLLPLARRDPEPQDDDRDTRETHRFLTTEEVADRYGITVSTVRTWKSRGKILPAFVDPARGAMYDPETLPSAAAVG
ncbi:helix-turn-helix domain-containing protein [Streptomyces asoensis]|uniref:Helix-turn-helix domain-containing protein n=1 Tax=Streptomyces asoensis TaxID=249586 RepID=A0A6M4WR48_9ACTN|nr:helix-turn-helix domain-containing protein [Streptomyces asoensis]QJT01775.1 helix-turn-helix domain-containing protein [Streptomyces asoensis]